MFNQTGDKMLIAKNVAQLPDVGLFTKQAAEKLDAQQLQIEQMQRDLDAKRVQMVADLRAEWSVEELAAAGIFG